MSKEEHIKVHIAEEKNCPNCGGPLDKDGCCPRCGTCPLKEPK
jgi:predicted amidophosphoribosyltransferase